MTTMKSPERIVVVRFDHIGDCILGIPLLRGLREKWPRAMVDLVVTPDVAGLMQGQSFFDRVLGFDPRGNFPAIKTYISLMDFATSNWGDCEVDLFISPRSDWFDFIHTALLGLLLRPRRAVCSAWYLKFPLSGNMVPGKTHRLVRRNAFDWVIHGSVSNQHELDRLGNLHVALALGEMSVPFIEILAEQKLRAAQIFQELDIAGRMNPIAIAPGARDPKRQWGLDRFFALIQVLAVDYPELDFLIIASPDERASISEFARGLTSPAVHILDCALAVVPAVLARCAWLVGNDSGPVHMAAAVGCPVTVISCHPIGADPGHQNAPERFAPMGNLALVMRPAANSDACAQGCSAVGRACCIRGIEVVRVANSVRLMMDQSAEPRS